MATYNIAGIGEDSIVARAAVDGGELVLLHNQATHYHIVFARDRDGVAALHMALPFSVITEQPATIVSSFSYINRSISAAFKLALEAFALLVHSKTEIDDEPMTERDADACPSCGCHPGDGATPGCTDPDGCGLGLGDVVPLPVPPTTPKDGMLRLHVTLLDNGGEPVVLEVLCDKFNLADTDEKGQEIAPTLTYGWTWDPAIPSPCPWSEPARTLVGVTHLRVTSIN